MFKRVPGTEWIFSEDRTCERSDESAFIHQPTKEAFSFKVQIPGLDPRSTPTWLFQGEAKHTCL